MLQGELTHHLGYEEHAVEGRNGGNSRNGTTPKSVETGQGELALEVPRDREGSFIPQIVPKGGASFTRLRREDPFALCPGNDGGRDSGPPGGVVWGRGFSRPDFGCHRCGAGPGQSLAVPAGVSGLPHPVVGCPGGQGARPWGDSQQGGLPGPGGPPGGRQGIVGSVAVTQRGGQILVAGAHRVEEPRLTRSAHRLRRWPQRFPRSPGSGISPGPGPVVYRPIWLASRCALSPTRTASRWPAT